MKVFFRVPVGAISSYREAKNWACAVVPYGWRSGQTRCEVIRAIDLGASGLLHLLAMGLRESEPTSSSSTARRRGAPPSTRAASRCISSPLGARQRLCST